MLARQYLHHTSIKFRPSKCTLQVMFQFVGVVETIVKKLCLITACLKNTTVVESHPSRGYRLRTDASFRRAERESKKVFVSIQLTPPKLALMTLTSLTVLSLCDAYKTGVDDLCVSLFVFS